MSGYTSLEQALNDLINGANSPYGKISSSSNGIVGSLSAALSTATTYGDGVAHPALPVNITTAIAQLAAGAATLPGPGAAIQMRVSDPISWNSDQIIATAPMKPGSGQSMPVSSIVTPGTYVPTYNYPAGSLLYAQPTLVLPSSTLLDGRYPPLFGGRLVGLGASYINANGANTTNSAAPNATYGSGLLTKIAQLSNGVLRLVGNFSLNAGTDGSAQCLAKVGQVIAAQADVCIVGPGIFDHDLGVITLAQTLQNLTTLTQILRANGCEPIFCGLPAKATAITTTEQVWQQTIAAAQDWAVRNKVLLIDLIGILTSGVNSLWNTTTPAFAGGSGLQEAGAGAHPNEFGHWVIAQAIWNAMLQHGVAHTPHWLPTSNSDPWNVLLNGTMQGAGNAAPTSWTAGGTSATGTFAYSTVTGIAGNTLTIALSTNDGSKQISQNVNVGGAGQPQIGDTIAFVGRMSQLTAQASGATFSAQLQFVGANDQHPAKIFPSPSIGADFNSPLSPGNGPQAWYTQAVIPAGTTQIKVILALNPTTVATTAASVGIGQVGVCVLNGTSASPPNLGITY